MVVGVVAFLCYVRSQVDEEFLAYPRVFCKLLYWMEISSLLSTAVQPLIEINLHLVAKLCITTNLKMIMSVCMSYENDGVRSQSTIFSRSVTEMHLDLLKLTCLNNLYLTVKGSVAENIARNLPL